MRNLKAGDIIRVNNNMETLLLTDIEARNGSVDKLGYVILHGINGFPCLCARVGTKVTAPPEEFDIEKYEKPYVYLGNIDVLVNALSDVTGEVLE